MLMRAGPHLGLLPGGAGRPLHSTFPPVTLIRSAGGIQAQSHIRAAADHFAVVIVLAVVFPAALVADLVGAALGEG
jgi:hypothetical protein